MSRFTNMYERFFPSNDADSFAKNIFKNFDANKDGEIDFKEFMIAIDVTSSENPREKLLWAFRWVRGELFNDCEEK